MPSSSPRAVLPVALASAVLLTPVVRHLMRTRHHPQWKSVTVLGGADDLRREPLDVLQDVEVRLVPAPGDRGTEVHARRTRAHGPAGDIALRTALRDLKQLTETGGLLHMDPRPHGRRRPTPQGLLQDEVEREAKGLGLL